MAALLMVLGSALFMQVAGLSMAMGAFLAGVLLPEFNFRHRTSSKRLIFYGIPEIMAFSPRQGTRRRYKAVSLMVTLIRGGENNPGCPCPIR